MVKKILASFLVFAFAAWAAPGISRMAAADTSHAFNPETHATAMHSCCPPLQSMMPMRLSATSAGTPCNDGHECCFGRPPAERPVLPSSLESSGSRVSSVPAVALVPALPSKGSPVSVAGLGKTRHEGATPQVLRI